MNADPYVATGWTPGHIGCHWSRGDYHASTIATGNGNRSGYTLHKDRVCLAEFVTWAEIERLADRRVAERRRACGAS